MILVTLVMWLSSASLVLNQKESPVTKVVNLLKQMQNQLTKEKKADEDVYEKMECWCETNDSETTDVIAAAQKAISTLTASIEEHAAKTGELQQEIANLKDEVTKHEESLAQAAEIRAKEAVEFSAEEKNMMETITALKQAVGILGKHHGEPAAEPAEEALLAVKHVLSSAKHQSHRASRVLALIEQPKSYNARSGEIFGILKEMKETFEKNISEAQKEEAGSVKAHEELQAEKKVEISKAKERIVAKTTQLSDTEVALVQAKADLKDARASLSADQKFLIDLKEKCASSDTEYAARQKSRQEEIMGVGDAIGILTNDDARDLFSSSLGKSFLQISANSEDAARQHVIDVLRKAAAKVAGKTGSEELLALAVSAQLDAFTKVKKAIAGMVAQLTQDQKDESEHRDWCKAELRSNDKSIWTQTTGKEDATALANKLGDTIETLDEEIKAHNAAIVEVKVQVKRASEDREAANKEFQQTVADQRATVAILTKALGRLQQVYAPGAAKEKAALLSKAKSFVQQAPERQAAPEGFAKKEKVKGSGGAIALLEGCVHDAKMLEEEALHAEQEAQTNYEDFVKDSANMIVEDQRAANDKTEAKAKAEIEKVGQEANLRAAEAELERLATYAGTVHAACDFVTKNFDIRQQARQDEIDALEDAQAILSGADFQ